MLVCGRISVWMAKRTNYNNSLTFFHLLLTDNNWRRHFPCGVVLVVAKTSKFARSILLLLLVDEDPQVQVRSVLLNLGGLVKVLNQLGHLVVLFLLHGAQSGGCSLHTFQSRQASLSGGKLSSELRHIRLRRTTTG